MRYPNVPGETLHTTASAAARYFLFVFGAGFILGMIRVPFLVPRLGARVAELIEMPFMLAVIYFAARHIVRRDASRLGSGDWIVAGMIALLLLLAAEVGMVLILQGRSVADYIASRDPVSGGVYLASLLLYAAMPWMQFRRQAGRAH